VGVLLKSAGFSWGLVLAVAVTAPTVAGAAEAVRPIAKSMAGPACRCPQIAIERYYENADIVLVGRADRLTPVEATDAAAHLEVEFTPLFRAGPFKGSIEGLVLATPVGTASCGVEVQPGESYIIFATIADPDEPRRAWFDSCSGSRLYAGGPRANEIEPFVGLPTNRIVPRLFELSDSTLAPQQPPGSAFHTSPACWSEVRIVHQGSPPDVLRDSIRIHWIPDAAPDTGGTASPNGAYRAWTDYRPEGEGRGAGGFVLVHVERPRRLRIAAAGSRAAPGTEWINEKLLFIRMVWGRVQFTDLIVDVERGAVLYEEAARYAAEAFDQFREACIGQCPCLALPGRTGELPSPPESRPADGDTDSVTGLIDALAYLDEDWDGRVFTEPGGLAYTVSGLHGTLGREDVPADVLEVRLTVSGWWLHVALYAVSTCSDPEATPVHAGWVPAFSTEGRPVASTWSGGC